MPNTSQQVRIQNALRNTAKDWEFPVKTYTDGVADDIDFDSTDLVTVVPASVECNEVEETYVPDTRYGREVKLARSQWAFQLILKFNQEVTLEEFVQGLLDAPPILSREGGFDPAFCKLARKSVTHPPREGASNGTQAQFIFAVTTGRH